MARLITVKLPTWIKQNHLAKSRTKHTMKFSFSYNVLTCFQSAEKAPLERLVHLMCEVSTEVGAQILLHGAAYGEFLVMYEISTIISSPITFLAKLFYE